MPILVMASTGIWPAEVLQAPTEAVQGILNGFLSSAKQIQFYPHNVVLYHESQPWVDGLAFLCSRLGLFCGSKHMGVPWNEYEWSIQGTDGQELVNRIPLQEDVWLAVEWREEDDLFSDKDVVHDPIVSIEPIKPNAKVYDFTVPATLNFGLANGLQVRDTSQTGYIQRKLIKGLEDIKVEYDMTVRNSKGKIVQFAYGDDGFDSIRDESQTLKLVGLSTQEIYMAYDFPELEKKNRDFPAEALFEHATKIRFFHQEKQTREWLQETITETIRRRDDIVQHVFKYKEDDSVRLPVSFYNIIQNIQGQMKISSRGLVDLTPWEAWQLLHGGNSIGSSLPSEPRWEGDAISKSPA